MPPQTLPPGTIADCHDVTSMRHTISNNQQTWAAVTGAPETPRPFDGDLVADVGKLLSDTRDLMSQLGGGATLKPSIPVLPELPKPSYFGKE
jgi:hypothetical protein